MPSRPAGLTSPYRGHRFPPEEIAHAVWLYFRFHFNVRDVQDLLAERGIIVSPEAIRLWCTKFGPTYAAGLRRRRARSGGTVSPDTYVVRKADLSIVARQIGPKLRMTVMVQGGTKETDVPEHDRIRPSVSDAQCIDAVRMAITLEDEMGWPVDVECAWQDGMCYLLQCRPITTLPNASGKH